MPTWGAMLWEDEVRNDNVLRIPSNRKDKREAVRMTKGKPSKGTPRDKRLKRNRKRRK